MSPKGSSSLKIDRSVKTLRELTLEKMRDAILSAYFKPGERLVERSLCEELGVSRSIVREVLRHLETEGLVESIPHQGPVVATLDTDKAAQIYEIRALLEGHAARLCAERADDETIERLAAINEEIQAAFARNDFHEVLASTSAFYELMFEGSGQTMAWEIVQSLNARINRLRAMTISSAGRATEAAAEMRLLRSSGAMPSLRMTRRWLTSGVLPISLLESWPKWPTPARRPISRRRPWPASPDSCPVNAGGHVLAAPFSPPCAAFSRPASRSSFRSTAPAVQAVSVGHRARQTLPVRSSNIFAGMLLDVMAATHYIDGRYSNYLCVYRSFIGGQPCNAT